MKLIPLEEAKKALDELGEFCGLENIDYWKKFELLESIPTIENPVCSVYHLPRNNMLSKFTITAIGEDTRKFDLILSHVGDTIYIYKETHSLHRDKYHLEQKTKRESIGEVKADELINAISCISILNK